MKRFIGVVLVVMFTVIMVGCAGYVRKDQYDRDVNELKRANEELANRNAQIEAQLRQADYQKILSERYAELSEEIKKWIKGLPGEIEIIGPGVIGISDVLFEEGKADIKVRGRELLKELGNKLKADGKSLQIVGNTDDVPIKAAHARYGIETNLELGMLRAKNVMLEFKKVGIPETKMFLASNGQNAPREPNTDKKSRAKNRRVEVKQLK